MPNSNATKLGGNLVCIIIININGAVNNAFQIFSFRNIFGEGVKMTLTKYYL